MLLSKAKTCSDMEGVRCWGSGMMHYSLGFEMIATSIGMVMPSYITEYYGASGFDFNTNTGYIHTPYPDQDLTWKSALTNKDNELLEFPNLAYIPSFYRLYKNFSKLIIPYSDYVDLPDEGTFWVGANSFLCCKQMYPKGTDPDDMIVYGCINEDIGFDCSSIGLYRRNTISGTMCQKSGSYSWLRSFNMPPIAECMTSTSKIFHVEYHGSYESNSFEKALTPLNTIYKKKYGFPITQTVEDYLQTKIKSIKGDFNPDYLNQQVQKEGSLGACHGVVDGQHVFYEQNNSMGLICGLSLSLYNPLNIGAKDIVQYPKEFSEKYGYFIAKKAGIVDLILYEDDTDSYGCAFLGDSDCDGCVSEAELTVYIFSWKQGYVGMEDLLEAISLWKSGC
jgi:hypothetical protein